MNPCGAKTKHDGTPCKRAGTGGAGGKCHLHGGKSTGRPIITGRYSVTHRKSLADKMLRHTEDPAPSDLLPELAMMRALFQDYLDRFSDGVRLPADDIGRLFALLESIGKQVERIEKIRAGYALTPAEVALLVASLLDVLKKYLPEDKLTLLHYEMRSRIGLPADVQSMSDEHLAHIVGGGGK